MAKQVLIENPVINSPFEKPAYGQAGHRQHTVKVVNHYGDRVLKVYEV